MPMNERAAHWRDSVLELREQGRRLGDRYLEVRFEQLKSNFRCEVHRLFEFAGVPLDDEMLERIREGTKVSSYGPYARASGFRGEGRVGGWRERFGVLEAMKFDRAAGDLLVELGYEPVRGWWRRLARERLPRVVGGAR